MRSEATNAVLREGESCAAILNAERAAVLIDVAQYFAAAKAAMRAARRTIYLLGWDFDPRTLLEPTPVIEREDMVLGPFLNRLKALKPELDIRILIWKMSWPIAVMNQFYPYRARGKLDPSIHFQLDGTAPYGSSRHEKLLIIDDSIAFCGGCDFARDRLDVRSHPDRPRWRVLPDGNRYPPRHDVMMCVEGETAQWLGAHFRDRWHEATAETLPPASADVEPVWPSVLPAAFENAPACIVLSRPADQGLPAVRQTETATLAAVKSASRHIYLENQYFTAPHIREALAARLREPDGPEIILVCTHQSPSYFDRATMDTARDAFMRRLLSCDSFGRLRIYAPRTEKGRPIIVHSKLSIFDDRILRIGSANLNNRACGYDTETDIALEFSEPQPAIAQILDTLLGHFAGMSGDSFAAHREKHPNLREALDALGADGKRLRPFTPRKRQGPVERLIAVWHFGDPYDVSEAWRAWRRQRDDIARSIIKGK